MSLEIQNIDGRGEIASQLRSLADAIESTGGAGSVVCVVEPTGGSAPPTIYISGQDAMAALMMAAANLESIIDSIPANATRI